MVQTLSMKAKLCSSPSLPTDLVPEIVSRLPCKSLFRFRSFSKTWRSIIEDPKFLKSNKNCPDSQILVHRVERDKTEFAVRCSKTFRVIAELNLPSEVEDANGLSECFDGLFLYESRKRMHNRLLLWNPFVGEVRILPKIPSQVYTEVNGRSTWSIGTGYDPLTEDYKHVRLSNFTCLMTGIDSVNIYMMRTNSWKTIPFEIKGEWFFRSKKDNYEFEKVCFRGVLYFIAETRYDTVYASQSLVSFNLSTEEFSAAKLPIEDYSNSYTQWHIKCASDDSRLAVIYTRGLQGCAWWARGEGSDVTWSKHYEFRLSAPMRCVLNVEVNAVDASEDEASMVLLLGLDGGVILYKLNDKKEEVLFRVSDKNDSRIVCASSYVKSFVLLN